MALSGSLNGSSRSTLFMLLLEGAVKFMVLFCIFLVLKTQECCYISLDETPFRERNDAITNYQMIQHLDIN